jgi:hypothetical protein
VKTRVSVQQPDGQWVVATLTWTSCHGALACQIVGALIASETMRSAIMEDSTRVNCKRIAVIACDLAEAMYAEMEVRDWLVQLPEPEAPAPSMTDRLMHATMTAKK